MKTLVTLLGMVCAVSWLPAATLYVDLNNPSPTPPFTNWLTAATNIQQAIDAASAGDTVLVTNGVYATGGKVMAGNLTNRIAVNKAITVQSVNGAAATSIQGSGTTNGTLGVRCAWLTNGATLDGFTLTGGATRTTGDNGTLQSGGGVWCASTNVMVKDCLIISNTANYYSGGSYYGNLTNCSLFWNQATIGGGAVNGVLNRSTITSNTASQSGGGGYNCVMYNSILTGNTAGFGGGVHLGTLYNCAVRSNTASANNGGGSYFSTLNNCTLTGNRASQLGGGSASGTLNNCILWGNQGAASQSNYNGGGFTYSCTLPLGSGTGNIAVDPQLLADGIHIAGTSPCYAAGKTNYVTGTDIDGQPWANPPAMGCDQLIVPGIPQPPRWQLSPGSGQNLEWLGSVLGPDTIAYAWIKDGVVIEDGDHYSGAQTTNLVVRGLKIEDAGGYRLVASNSFGMTTSQVARLVIRCVDAAAASPVAPYTNWAMAAGTIQDAINVATAGDLVWVTNGVYGAGGKVMGGDLTNRVAVDKATTLLSVNGSGSTIIQGNWNPAVTNGPAAVRCVWLTNGAVLSGFTLRGGATRAVTVSPNQQMNGGGVWGSSTNAMVMNCVIGTNFASYQGGGAYQVSLNNCTLIGNRAVGSGSPGSGVGSAGSGGGAVECNLRNCRVTANYAEQGNGGGVLSCNLTNCALIQNSAPLNGGAANGGTLLSCTVSGNISSGYTSGYGAAVYGAKLTNCVVWGNYSRTSYPNTNYASCTLAYCASYPLPAGVGNMDLDPQLLADGIHLAASSPCRSAGTNIVFGTDIDGQSWTNPPAIGCDEWQPEPLIVGQASFEVLPGSRTLSFTGTTAGQEPFIFFWSKDGNLIQNDAHYISSSTSNLVVSRFDVSDAGGYQFVVSNVFGMATSQVAQVTIRCADAAGTNPVASFFTWATAATNIQDAIDAASAGEIVLVTNGVYATGGKAMYGDLTNRVALDKPLTVLSVNGPLNTTIKGAWDPVSTNGPLAVRCAWLTNGAVLGGFTLAGGATRTTGVNSDSSGGGVWCVSIYDSVVMNCIIVSNTAYSGGGGSFFGALRNCAIIGNAVLGSFAGGGGALGGKLVNCTIVGNYAPSVGGGQQDATLTNCIIYLNSTQRSFLYADNANFAGRPNCSPLLSAPNISADPQLVDAYHVATTSPCRGAGTNIFYGSDVDGQAWGNPPSIGCDEFSDSERIGPLSVSIQTPLTNTLVGRFVPLTGQIMGLASRLEWSFGDGPLVTNVSYLTSHVWTNAGDYPVVFTAYNTDNPGGVTTNVVIHVSALESPLLESPVWTTNGFSCQFSGQSGAVYSLQRATTLTPPVSWTTVQTLATSGGLMQMTNAATTNAMMFYRVTVQ